MSETNEPMPTPSNFCLCSSRSCETCTCDDEHEAALDAWQDKQDENLRELVETYKDEDTKMEHYDNLEEQREFKNEAREEGLE